METILVLHHLDNLLHHILHNLNNQGYLNTNFLVFDMLDKQDMQELMLHNMNHYKDMSCLLYLLQDYNFMIIHPYNLNILRE